MVRSFFVRACLLDIEQRPAPGKTVFDPVPMADRRFTQLPAEKDDFCSQQARKIDEALFHPLADTTVALYLFHAIFDFRHQLCNFTIPLQSVHKIRGLWIQMFMTYDCFALVSQSPNIFLDPFSQRTHGGQQRIGFIHRKKPPERDRGDHSYLSLAA
jgi:hypothetical protein